MDNPRRFSTGPRARKCPTQVMHAIQNYLMGANANTCGAFLTSRRTDEMLVGARAAMADFFHCERDEVVFGQNMTTITFAISRAIGRELNAGDEILLTTLDHDANFSPWKALEEKGVVIRQVDIREDDCTLNLDDLKSKLNEKTKLVAVGYASNAVGTINPVAEITRLAHAAGALGVHRCGALCAAWLDRREGTRLRFSGVLALQILWTAHGHALRKAPAPAGLPAV